MVLPDKYHPLYTEEMIKKILNSKYLRILISLLILTLLFYKIGFTRIQEALSNFDLVYSPFILIAYFLSFLFGAINVKLLTNCINPIKFWKIFSYYTQSWCYGLWSVGRIGEFSMIYFLKDENISVGQATAISIIDRGTTFIVVSIIAVFGFFLFFSFEAALRLLAILLLMIILALFFIFTKRGRSIIKKYFLRKYADKFTGFSKTLFFYLRRKKAALFVNFLLTNLKWITTAYINYFFFMAFGISISIVYIIIITAISAIISLIPLSISGLGFRESAGVYLFSLKGVPVGVSGSLFIILGAFNYLFSGIFILHHINRKSR